MAQASDVMVPSSAAAAVGMIVCVLCDDPEDWKPAQVQQLCGYVTNPVDT
jgi:hypothetical protein